jgi:hypothetical protein
VQHGHDHVDLADRAGLAERPAGAGDDAARVRARVEREPLALGGRRFQLPTTS